MERDQGLESVNAGFEPDLKGISGMLSTFSAKESCGPFPLSGYTRVTVRDAGCEDHGSRSEAWSFGLMERISEHRKPDTLNREPSPGPAGCATPLSSSPEAL